MTDHLENSILIVRKGALVRQLIDEAEAASTPERSMALYLKAHGAAGAVSRAARYQLALYSEIPGERDFEKDCEKDGDNEKVA